MNIKIGEFKSKDLLKEIQLFNSDLKVETSFQAGPVDLKTVKKLRNLIK